MDGAPEFEAGAIWKNCGRDSIPGRCLLGCSRDA